MLEYDSSVFIVMALYQVNVTCLGMKISLLKSKLHPAVVTDANVEYEGSMTISKDLMDKAGLFAYEKILCGNLYNGNRFETYVIPGEAGRGEIILNGGTAHLGQAGDRVTIMAFAEVDAADAVNWKPTIVICGEGNVVERIK